uniref:Class I SAM-dependent methyltransferase n=1 Tax=candidate division WOR-3 bacterium TaxID=2052148 RepID=A0A7V0Z6R4_UNCW3
MHGYHIFIRALNRNKMENNNDEKLIKNSFKLIQKHCENVHRLKRPNWMRTSPLFKRICRILFSQFHVSIFHYVRVFLKDKSGYFFEAGCGRGDLLLLLSNQFNYLVGCDFSQTFLQDAQEKINHWYNMNKNTRVKIKVLQHDLNYPLPLESASFDAVAAIAVAEHVYDVFFLFRELRRVLKPDGILIVQVPNLAYIKHRVRLVFGKPLITQLAPPSRWHIEGYDGGHIHYFTKDSLAMVLKISGFNDLRWMCSGTLAKIRNFWPSLLGGDLVCIAHAANTIYAQKK